jgi:hypothetical protein
MKGDFNMNLLDNLTEMHPITNIKYIHPILFWNNIDKIPDPVPKEWLRLLAMYSINQDFVELIAAMTDLSTYSIEYETEEERPIPKEAARDRVEQALEIVMPKYQDSVEKSGIWQYVDFDIEELWTRLDELGTLREKIIREDNITDDQIEKYFTYLKE